jgi:hypothetical protein
MRTTYSGLPHGLIVFSIILAYDRSMKRIVLDVRDEQKAEALLVLLRDLTYVDTQVDDGAKVWDGRLSVLDNPIHVEDYRVYSRDELHER